MAKSSTLPISSVNHFSLLCSSVEKSSAFYEDVLGFFPIRRPGSFDFDGAWLFNYGMGIHLIRASNPSELPKNRDINPKDNHMSFQTGCQNMEEVEERLRELGVRYIRVEVEEGGIRVDQIFFHDPDGFMIEVCTCDNLPLVPLKSSPSALSVLSGPSATCNAAGAALATATAPALSGGTLVENVSTSSSSTAGGSVIMSSASLSQALVQTSALNSCSRQQYSASCGQLTPCANQVGATSL